MSGRADREGLAIRAALLALAAAWPLGARAYRPFDSTDAAVAAKGDVELELGPVGWLVEGRERSLVAPSVVVNWGFAERWEAVAEARHFIHLGGADVREPQLRVEDTALSVKHVVRDGSLQDRSGASVALEASALLPTVQHDGVGTSLAIIASRRWRTATVHLDGAVAWTRTHVPGAFAGVIVEGPDAWRVRPVGEAFVEGERGAAWARSGLVGAIWRLSEALSLDAAVRAARAGAVRTLELRAGLTWAFGAR